MRASVFIVVTFALFGLSLEQEGAINDDPFVGAQSREHFDLTAKITATADAPNLERARVLLQEDAPFVPNALHRRDRYREDGIA
jgi:hypothetical protein